MHNIGLKLWNTNTDYYYSEAIRLFNDGIFDYIELYIVPDNMDKLLNWKKVKIPFDIHAAHSAFNVNLSKNEFSEYNYSKYLEAKVYADELKSSIIIFHGGINGDYKETAKQIKDFNDNRILIENKPYKPLNGKSGDKCVGSSLEEIKYIMTYSNCGFCLDIGHAICSANTQRINPYVFIEKLVQLKPERIHLSDLAIDSEYDEHLNFGYGNVDLKKVLSLIPDNINITIETIKKSNCNLDGFKKDALYLKSLM